MPQQTWVSDEVWAELDPSLARLPRRSRVKVAISCVVAAVVIAAGLVATASGLFVHRLSVSGGDFAGSGARCQMSLSIDNDGWFDEHVLSTTLRPNGTGATLMQDVAGLTIPSGGSRDVRVRYTGSICDQLESAPVFQSGVRKPPQLVLQLRRPWGTSSDSLGLAPPPDLDGVSIHL